MPTCDELGIPSRLWTPAGKATEPFTDEREILFRRTHPDINLGEPDFLSAASLGKLFHPPVSISCNRSSLCRYATDVLYSTVKLPHHTNWGIICSRVREISSCEFDFEGEIGRFQVEHRPELCMFPHSEIDVYIGTRLVDDPVKPPRMKSIIRGALAQHFEAHSHGNPSFVFPQDRSYLAQVLGDTWKTIKSYLRWPRSKTPIESRQSNDKVERSMSRFDLTRSEPKQKNLDD